MISSPGYLKAPFAGAGLARNSRRLQCSKERQYRKSGGCEDLHGDVSVDSGITLNAHSYDFISHHSSEKLDWVWQDCPWRNRAKYLGDARTSVLANGNVGLAHLLGG